MKTYLLLQSALFLSATLAVQAGPVVNQYFPMNNGDNRYYQYNPTPSYTATEYFTQTSYNGHSVFALNINDEWETYPLAQHTWYFGTNGSALALFGINSEWGNMPFNSPVNLLTDQIITNNLSTTNFVTGTYYAGAAIGYITYNYTIQTTVIAYPGTYTVPMGSFTNCKLVGVLITDTYGGVFQSSYDSAAWILAPGAGIIADGVATWDYYAGWTSTSDYLELISGTINNVPIDFTPPSNILTSWPANGDQLYINPLFIWGTASDASLGGSGIAQVTVNGNRASNDTASGSGSAVWSAYVNLTAGANTITVVAMDGAGNRTTNLLTVTEMLPAPSLTSQPTSQAVAPGANVSFNVTAASSLLSLSYQWWKDGAALSGATNSNYSITGVLTNQAGNYKVVVTNASGSITSSNALLFVDGQKPTITITNPAANARLSNAVAQVSGTASDNGQVAQVFYKLNAGGWLAASGTSNWQSSVTLIPGTNIFSAYSIDWVGNISVTNSENIIYVVTALATVQTNGNGTISPNYNGQPLEIGRNYSMTATAGAGFAFTNWSGGINLPLTLITNGPTIQFLMVTNLMLQANFVDVTKPTLSITNVTAGMNVSNAAFTVKGTAGDNVAVASVYFSLSNAAVNTGFAPATTANNWANWSTNVTLVAGTNTIAAYAVDNSGNISPTNSVKLVYVLSATLTVRTNGIGSINPNDNGALLQIGAGYS